MGLRLIQILILAAILLTSCRQNNEPNKLTGDTVQKEVLIKENKIDNALAFINGYNENSSKIKDVAEIIEWVNSNGLTTNSFRNELKRIIDNAYEQDPELGLGADPIFDAQDNPDKGFEIESFDEETNYLIVKGIDWPEFKLTIKLAKENGQWLVDGCGMVNIPNDKRAVW